MDITADESKQWGIDVQRVSRDDLKGFSGFISTWQDGEFSVHEAWKKKSYAVPEGYLCVSNGLI